MNTAVIRIYGPGCTNCRRLEQHTREALVDSPLPYQIQKVEDYGEMMEAGVLRTPALSVDGKLILQGRVPSIAELRSVLAGVLAEQR